jgi:hypothetical protein
MASDPFVIEEAQGPNPLRVELLDHDLPMGRPRKSPAFELGGPVEHQAIFLHGRTEPIIHVAQARFHPTVVKGHFRDHFTGEPGRAFARVETLERIRRRARLLSLSWGRLRWTAFLEDAKFPVEGPYDLAYELRFRVLLGPTAPSTFTAAKAETAPADLTARVRAILERRRLQMLATFLTTTARGPLRKAFETADTALTVVEQSAAAFEAETRNVASQATALIGAAESARGPVKSLELTVRSATPESSLQATSTEHVLPFWAAQYGTLSDLSAVVDALRASLFAARQRLRHPEA